ncbi:TIGR03617 family F420-dependent LLM class oxidoreductase [Rhodococcus oxybenzonivorans]|uniref:TIGR03617 family F420-dependent LLM class oxidoreductase n=1 Tax=Rhodococcus oxybenzonivorans TaxID=1990687 RepID=UPI00295504BA|nr:TIGR03617 family F420-dependent LLM class oxidoreductase [Rhodococcus oxybenzonivorans]MDV7352799.1 TIGR03617 family F420-dependent LLM class oxidoreductase [Rhodococcus oxybenzonivorans]
MRSEIVGSPRFGVTVDPGMGRVAEVAQRAEAVGFDGLFLGETSHDPLLLLAAASQTTSTMALGTSIYVAFARTPMVTAVAANDVQALSHGRLQLGLGSQVKAHITRRFSMPWSRPAARMREYVQALHAIWDTWENGSALKFEGEFYQHTLMSPIFDPGPNPFGRPSVQIAGVGEAMARVAGEVADGLLVHSFVTDRYLEEVVLPSVEQGLLNSGRSRSDFTIGVTPMLASGTTDEEIADAREYVRGQIAFYGSTPSYRGVLDLHGWSGLHEKLHELSRAGEWDAMRELIDDEVLAEFAIVGPAEEAAVALVERWGTVSDHISIAARSVENLDAWRAIGTTVSQGI